ncbi:MAG TPA: flagellar filament capping protein FliD [Bryobacteraceae bacterium]|nr:flagellar filament capping protein FliD [Bryobacteraceae bacterium]
MGTSSTNPAATPLYFTGVSTFSNDFQSIIQRAVQIASLPVQSLQNEQSTVNSQQQALTALEPTVSALGTDVANLGSLATSQGLAASSSNASIVSVVNTGASAPANYTISSITSLATAASETSLQGYSASQSVSASGHVNLVVGSNTYALDLTGAGQNNIAGLANAINNAQAGVTATVLTAGSTQYLTVSANSTGATTLQLNEVTPGAPPPVDLITNNGTGSETSVQSYADLTTAPVSNTGSVQFAVGSKTYSLDVSGANNNLNGLVSAINGAKAGVTASVIGNAGNFVLALSAPGATQMQLLDEAPANLLSATNQGANASFTVNGITLTKSSNNITDVIPGVSFILLNKTSAPVTLSLATDPSQLSNALQTFVTDYNSLVTAVKAQQGQNAGPLQGNLIINQINSAMQDLATYWNPTGNSTIRSLSDLGVTFNSTGQMSFDPNTFNALSDNQISDAFKFLGSASSGFAGLAANFTQLSDPISGMIETQINGYQSQLTEIADHIGTAQTRVNQIQQAITQQMQQADSLVAELQQQQNNVDASIQSLNYVIFGRQVGVNGR